MVDNQVYDSQIVAENSFANLPEDPSKGAYYTFKGWSINRTSIVNVEDVHVNRNVTYVALFEFSFKGNYTLTFYYIWMGANTEHSYDFTMTNTGSSYRTDPISVSQDVSFMYSRILFDYSQINNNRLIITLEGRAFYNDIFVECVFNEITCTWQCNVDSNHYDNFSIERL